MPTARPRPDSRARILAGALERFTAYGYRRTALEDIAQAAGLSRASVYVHFRNKEDVFRALARQLHTEGLAAAESAAAADGPLAVRLRALFTAKLTPVATLARTSPHAAELLDENDRVAGDVAAEFRKRLVRVLARLVAAAIAAGEVDPARVGLSARGAAELIVDGVKGIEIASAAAAATPAQLTRRVGQLVDLVVAGLALPAPIPHGRRA
ncbi:MAG: TetR/AcrR family transcriptional regulator [bacterium]|nr:TetR/AcrR family transcriptional regulator [bacterium]